MNPRATWSALSRFQKALLLSLIVVFAVIGGGVVLLLSTSGGGSGSENTVTELSPTSIVQLPDPCALLSLQDARQVFGKLALESKSTPMDDSKNCFYRVSGGANGANPPSYGCPLGLGIDVWRDRALDPTKNEGVSGLGDEAYWVTKLGTPSLWVRKGDIRFSLGLTYDSYCEGQTEDVLASKAQATIETLARTVLSRLG